MEKTQRVRVCQKVFGSKGLEKQNKKAQQKGVANASCLQCSRRAFLLFRVFFLLFKLFISFLHIFQTEHFQRSLPFGLRPDQLINLSEAARVNKAHLKYTTDHQSSNSI